MIREIAFVVYPSNDVAATRAWYEDVLGLTFAGPYGEDGVEKYNEAHIGAGCFGLMAAEWVERDPGSAAAVAFEVDDLDDAVRTLHAKGVVDVHRFDGPVCRQATLNDPEGNKITLHQKTAQA